MVNSNATDRTPLYVNSLKAVHEPHHVVRAA